VKESKEFILSEYNNLEKEISSLQLFQTITENGNISVEFVLSLTLIDGKVLNVLTGTKSMQTCSNSHRNPKHFNVKANIEGRLFVLIKSALTFGISPLHAYIRTFERCLQISHRLNIKRHHVRSEEDKLEFNSRKAYIQNQFWEKLSLRVSQPKPGGYGDTNTGNTARRAFKDIDVLSKITGLKSELLYKRLRLFRFRL